MTDRIFKEKDLPVEDLKKLGIYSGDGLTIDKEDRDALLAGRRTDMITLRDLKAEGFRIEQLDARLSLSREPDGTFSLRVHPIYKEAQQHPLLINREAEHLKSGEISSVVKTFKDKSGKEKTTVIEYDKETREFVSYDPTQVTPPDRVNGVSLSQTQKNLFRKGRVVELSDGTRFQFRASDRKGLLSNRAGLILSIVLDGGVSYLLITGIRNVFESKNKQLETFTEGYRQALKDMENIDSGMQGPEQQLLRNSPKQLNRGYKRGRSR